MASAYLAISFLKQTPLPEFLSCLPQQPLKDYLSSSNIYKGRKNRSKQELIDMIISEKI